MAPQQYCQVTYQLNLLLEEFVIQCCQIKVKNWSASRKTPSNFEQQHLKCHGSSHFVGYIFVQLPHFEMIQFVHLYPLGQSLRHILDKVTYWHFQSTSKEVIWPKEFLNYMHGLKSAILAIFQKGLGWPCPVSAAHKNASQHLKNSFSFG